MHGLWRGGQPFSLFKLLGKNPPDADFVGVAQCACRRGLLSAHELRADQQQRSYYRRLENTRNIEHLFGGLPTRPTRLESLVMARRLNWMPLDITAIAVNRGQKRGVRGSLTFTWDDSRKSKGTQRSIRKKKEADSVEPASAILKRR